MSPTSIALQIDERPDEPAFSMLHWKDREIIRQRLHALKLCCANASDIKSAMKEFAVQINVPYKTARRIADHIRAKGWRGAADGRALRVVESVGSRLSFIQFWKELCERHGRSNRAAWSDLILMWRHGEVIPGYDEMNGHPPEGPKGIPEGWGYENLLNYAPSHKQLVLARLGRKHFEAESTTFWSTRVGLPCGSLYQFDDVLGDNKVFHGKQFVRPWELGIIDVASTKRVLFALCPQLREDGVKRGIKDRYALWMILGLLTEVGYHEDGCSLIVEHKTASISERLEKAILDVTKDKVRTLRSGIADKPKMLGWWAGEGGGNPRMKAVLESLHNLYHNRKGLIPAQTGSNSRLDKPEDLQAIEKCGEKLMAELDKLPLDRVVEIYRKLQLPALTMQAYHQLLYNLYEVIDSRTMHDIEGWEKSNYLRVRWRMNEFDTWHDEEDLDGFTPEQMAMWRAVVERKPGLVQPIKLSPNEVWARRGRFKRIQQHLLPGLAGFNLGHAFRITGRCIEFEDADIDPDGLRFSGIVQDPFGQQILIKPKEPHLAFVNPFRPDVALITDPDLRYIGAAARIERASRVDDNAVFAAIGKSAHESAIRMQEYRDRHAGDSARLQEMQQNNERVFQEAKSMIPRPRSRRPDPRDGLGDIFGAKQPPVAAADDTGEESRESDLAAILGNKSEDQGSAE